MVDQGLETKVALIDQRQVLHEKACDERQRHMVTTIDTMNRRAEKQEADQSSMVARVHSRIDDVSTTVTRVETTMKQLPEQIAAFPELVKAEVKSALQGSRLKEYAQLIGLGVVIIGYLVDKFVIHHGG